MTELAAGRRVEQHSLKTSAERNGQRGFILELLPEHERWAVELVDSPHDCLRVKGGNLSLVDSPPAEGAWIDVVVIPPTSPPYLLPLTCHRFGRHVGIGMLISGKDPHLDFCVDAKTDSAQDIVSCPIFQYFSAAASQEKDHEDQERWMAVWCADVFRGKQLSTNMVKFGWGGSDVQFCGWVMVDFNSAWNGSEGEYDYAYEPFAPRSPHLKALLREHAEARVRGHPTRQRIIENRYKEFPVPIFGEATMTTSRDFFQTRCTIPSLGSSQIWHVELSLYFTLCVFKRVKTLVTLIEACVDINISIVDLSSYPKATPVSNNSNLYPSKALHR